MSRSQDSKAAAIKEAASHAEFIAKSCEGNRPIPQSFPVRMLLNPGVHPVGSIDVAQMGPPSAQLSGHVRYPQAVTPAQARGIDDGSLNARHNPMQPFRQPPRRAVYQPKEPKPTPRSIPDQAFNELFAGLTSNRDQALIAFNISTGAHAAEAARPARRATRCPRHRR